MSEHGALNGRILDEDLGGTQILNTRSDVADYILVRNPFADPHQPSSANMTNEVFGK